MSQYILLITILFPILASVLIRFIPFKKNAHMEAFVELIVIVTSLLVFWMLYDTPEEFQIISFSNTASITFRIDGAGRIFAGLVSALWPFAVLYAFEYMEHDKRKNTFFMFYTMTFGITLGIAFSGNILTMYLFYELLTLITVPLVIHTFTREAILAARKYVLFSMGGASLGFMAVVFVLKYASGDGFVYGGILTKDIFSISENFPLLIYLLAFLGFGVKAAIFPFYSWLPDAGVAPTPVTALLHAVAVVKAGAFATIRLTYYSFGTELLYGTWAQKIVMGLAMFTLVFGCSIAVKETHLKRRLAFSTISNLSYILFGVSMMSPDGLYGAFTHMICHAVMKISAFFCVGAIMHHANRNYVHETNGLAKQMPWVYGAFTVASLGLMGAPGLCGFISKWYLAKAALNSEDTFTIIGVGALLVSALLTAIYMMTMIVRAYFPENDFDMSTISDIDDPSWKMIVPLVAFSIAIIIIGVRPTLITTIISKVATGAL